MKIVTGYTGQPHISSNAVQGFNRGLFGPHNLVLSVGNKFRATLTDVNTVTISSGEGYLDGVHFRIDPGTTETVNISNGTTGYKRIDYICARYEKNAITGVESVNLIVLEGTPSESSPVPPTINTGDVLVGATPVDFPLYRVDLDGLTPTITTLFETATTIYALENSLSNLGIHSNTITLIGAQAKGGMNYFRIGNILIFSAWVVGVSGSVDSADLIMDNFSSLFYRSIAYPITLGGESDDASSGCAWSINDTNKIRVVAPITISTRYYFGGIAILKS